MAQFPEQHNSSSGKWQVGNSMWISSWEPEISRSITQALLVVFSTMDIPRHIPNNECHQTSPKRFQLHSTYSGTALERWWDVGRPSRPSVRLSVLFVKNNVQTPLEKEKSVRTGNMMKRNQGSVTQETESDKALRGKKTREIVKIACSGQSTWHMLNSNLQNTQLYLGR